MACPHVVWAIALLKQAYPNKTGHELKIALYTTAVDLGTTGEDNDYGMGLIDVYAAYLSLLTSMTPNAPSNFSAYSDYTTPGSMQLSWDDPTQYENGDTLLTSEFKIMVERDSILIDSVAGGTEHYTDTGLIDGQLYHYGIFTKVNATGSASSIISTEWTSGGARQPRPPENFTISVLDSIQHRAHWTNPVHNIDGTPLDDFAQIDLYEDDSLFLSLTRLTTDTGQVDSVDFTPTAGFHQYYLVAVDNETPPNASDPGSLVNLPLTGPFSDNFSTPPHPNSAYWINEQAEITNLCIDPPSPPYALTMNGDFFGGDVVAVKSVDISHLAGQGLVFSYWYQPQGSGNQPEPEDSLIIELKNDLGQWKTGRAYPGTGLEPFQQEIIPLDTVDPGPGATFFHSDFQLRFRNRATVHNLGVDHWFIDDTYFGIADHNPQMIVSPKFIIDTLFTGQAVYRHVFIKNLQITPSLLYFSVREQPDVNWLDVSPDSG